MPRANTSTFVLAADPQFRTVRHIRMGGVEHAFPLCDPDLNIPVHIRKFKWMTATARNYMPMCIRCKGIADRIMQDYARALEAEQRDPKALYVERDDDDDNDE